jgi:hypothetical protein
VAEAEHIVRQPSADGRVELVQFAREEVVDSLHYHEMVLARKRSDKRFDFRDRTMFIVAAVDEKFWLMALAQEREIGAVDGKPQADQMRDSLIRAANPQADPGAKTESRKQNWHARKFLLQKIQRTANVILFAVSAVVLAGT